MTTVEDVSAPLPQRQVLRAVAALLLGLLVAVLSSTVVATALPRPAAYRARLAWNKRLRDRRAS